MPKISNKIFYILSLGLSLIFTIFFFFLWILWQQTDYFHKQTTLMIHQHVSAENLLLQIQSEEDLLLEVIHDLFFLNKINEKSLDKLEKNSDLTPIQNGQTDFTTKETKKKINQLIDLLHNYKNNSGNTLKTIETIITTHHQLSQDVNDLIKKNHQSLKNIDHKIQNDVNLFQKKFITLFIAVFLTILICATAIALYVFKIQTAYLQHSKTLQTVSWQMLQNQEDTARRFSHELHDELGQSLAALKIWLQSNDHDEETKKGQQQLIDEAINSVREISQLMHPVILDDFGLGAAIHWFTTHFEQRTKIKVITKIDDSLRLQNQIELHLFRIIQESFTNIARHSKATITNINFQKNNFHLSLIIEDNGIGFETTRMNKTSLGLIGIKARASECQSIVIIDSKLFQGTKIHIKIPLSLLEQEVASS
jgi:signal transduction histidine kinase